MHFLISSELQRNGAALALRLSHSQLRISQTSLPFKALTNPMRTTKSETEKIPSTLNGKQQYGFFSTNGNILLVKGSILNLQFCVNMVYHAVNILHASS